MSNSYKEFLKTRKPISLPSAPTKLLGAEQGIPSKKLIAPLNADISFISGKKVVLAKPKMLLGAVPLPKNWTNYSGNEQKYKLTTRPMNQGLCGSCFACSSATSINDAFVFAGLNFNPNISPMYILACLSGNAQCNGGNAHLVLTQIQDSGIVSNHCLDYDSICDNSPYCSPESSQSDQEQINSMIPPCGCCALGTNSFCGNSPIHYKYYVKNVEVAATNANDVGNFDNSQEINIDTIKNHIYKFGGAVSGFQVYQNFLIGGQSNFADTKGIYFETEPYGADSPQAYQGCHAISVVGWGIEESPITLKNGPVVKNVQYWVVRNSWGTNWGDNGYFKIAMYNKINNFEINPTTALERINVNQIDNSQDLGGIILFEPASYSEYNDSRSDCSYLDNLQNQNELKSFYCNEPSPSQNIPNIPNIPETPDDSKDKSNISSFFTKRNIIIGTVVLVLLIFVSYLMRKRN
jgi:hypothetical protein